MLSSGRAMRGCSSTPAAGTRGTRHGRAIRPPRRDRGLDVAQALRGVHGDKSLLPGQRQRCGARKRLVLRDDARLRQNRKWTCRVRYVPVVRHSHGVARAVQEPVNRPRDEVGELVARRLLLEHVILEAANLHAVEEELAKEVVLIMVLGKIAWGEVAVGGCVSEPRVERGHCLNNRQAIVRPDDILNVNGHRNVNPRGCEDELCHLGCLFARVYEGPGHLGRREPGTQHVPKCTPREFWVSTSAEPKKERDHHSLREKLIWNAGLTSRAFPVCSAARLAID
eukprot:6559050-Pyramimonas_sp.AAC.2